MNICVTAVCHPFVLVGCIILRKAMWLLSVLAVMFGRQGIWELGWVCGGRGTAQPQGRVEGLCNCTLMKDAGFSKANARDGWEAYALGMS